MPKVSVCIPAYKQTEFLRKTLSSVLMQDFTDFELIISDDSTCDSVENLLHEFNFETKLKYFRNTHSLGSPANWNFALKQAGGEYLKILHHDDYFTSKKSLSQFVNLLDKSPSCSFAFSGTLIDILSLKTQKIHSCSMRQFSKLKAAPDSLFFSNYIGAPSATILRNRDFVLYDEKLKWLVDVDWYMQLIYANPNLNYTSVPLICTVHGGEGQITQSVFKDREIQVREHVYLFEKLFKRIVDWKKYSLFFQLLFHKYEINNLSELRLIYPVSENTDSFFNEVFEAKNSLVFFKKMYYWLNKIPLNDHLFTLKTYFK